MKEKSNKELLEMEIELHSIIEGRDNSKRTKLSICNIISLTHKESVKLSETISHIIKENGVLDFILYGERAYKQSNAIITVYALYEKNFFRETGLMGLMKSVEDTILFEYIDKKEFQNDRTGKFIVEKENIMNSGITLDITAIKSNRF